MPQHYPRASTPIINRHLKFTGRIGLYSKDRTLNISTLSKNEFNTKIKGRGLRFQIGPFNVELKTKIPQLYNNIYALYSDAKLLANTDFVDFHITLKSPSLLRRYVRPQVDFIFDQSSPFKPLPLDQTSAFFEWGLNWAIAQHAMQYLIIHSAVLEKDGKAIIFPGMPGAGKSTLCAAMCHHGWRLLSDEQALISIDTGLISPLARPICLKNQSIDIIKDYCPDALFSDIVKNTSKGDIAHVKAPIDAIEKIELPAKPFLIVFPQYSAEAKETQLTAMTHGMALIELISHCFNYTTLALDGFTTLANTVSQSDCYQLRYRNLDQALAIFKQLYSDANQ